MAHVRSPLRSDQKKVGDLVYLYAGFFWKSSNTFKGAFCLTSSRPEFVMNKIFEKLNKKSTVIYKAKRDLKFLKDQTNKLKRGGKWRYVFSPDTLYDSSQMYKTDSTALQNWISWSW